jgi:formylglycine-generating enzyme required for sulfatase activity
MQLPARIGKYELLEFLGGGMSHVYRARDTVIGRPVAVKILTEIGMQDPEVKTRFLNEARMAGNIAHDNIVNIHDYGEEDGRPFIVMEFLKGKTLKEVIYDGSAGDWRTRLKLALQVAKALEFVHSHGIIHRDIKPENIHVDASGRCKLMDFGIAKSENLSLTKTGNTLGTPYYMAPEQILGMKITEQADVYSFGVVLYEMFAGKRPVSGDTIESIFYQILNQPLDPKPLEESGTPAPLCQMIQRCTVKQADQRYPNFTAVAQGIAEMLGESPAPLPEAQASTGRMIALIALALVTGVAIFYAIQTVWTKTRKPEPLKSVIATTTGEMVLVPAGDFLFGEKKQKRALPAFYIDKTEVTNRAYAQFCKERSYPLPPDFRADLPDYPVVNIRIVDAQAYAKWAQKRLPNTEEWEKAARGTDGRIYPWGNEIDEKRANVSSTSLQPVNSFPAGASPYGALNMTGNALEFIDELKAPSPQALESFARVLNPPPTAQDPWYIIKGGAYDQTLASGVLYEFASVPGRLATGNIGFRCAKSP